MVDFSPPAIYLQVAQAETAPQPETPAEVETPPAKVDVGRYVPPTALEVTIIVTVALPKFRTFFGSLNAKLPLPTRILLGITDFEKVARSRRKKIQQPEQPYQPVPRGDAIDGHRIVMESPHQALRSRCRIHPAHGRPIRKSAQIESAPEPRGSRRSAG